MLLPLLLLGWIAGEPGRAAPGPRAVGWVEMSPSGVLTVIEDADPQRPVTIVPSDPQYRLWLEMTGNPRPGTRSRTYAFAASYDAGPDNYAIHGWARSPSAVSEPATKRIGRGDAAFQCWDKVLRPKGLGSHILSFAEGDAVEACLRRR